MDSVLAFGGQIISNSELHERLRRMSIEVTRALIAAIDKKDHYTSNHSERGGFLTRLTAQELGVPLEEQQYMEWAGLLHDVGKIGIPEEILCKPGKLTEAEFAIIREHPRMGYEILQPIRSFKHVLDGVLYHHEYPDGSGYPEGLKGEEIPLVARIIHVVDTFDALTSTRAYRKAFTVDRALEMIRAEMGRRIDGPVAEAFFRALDRFRREQPAQFAQLFPERVEQADDPS
jgi:HD-GYP domain-containing protein (c-di-GMP phosphodiesterase class II)